MSQCSALGTPQPRHPQLRPSAYSARGQRRARGAEATAECPVARPRGCARRWQRWPGLVARGGLAVSDPQQRAGRIRALHALLERAPVGTALSSSADTLAIGARRAARELGRRYRSSSRSSASTTPHSTAKGSRPSIGPPRQGAHRRPELLRAMNDDRRPGLRVMAAAARHPRLDRSAGRDRTLSSSRVVGARHVLRPDDGGEASPPWRRRTASRDGSSSRTGPAPDRLPRRTSGVPRPEAAHARRTADRHEELAGAHLTGNAEGVDRRGGEGSARGARGIEDVHGHAMT